MDVMTILMKRKRGIVGGEVITKPLSEKAQEEFGLYCEANLVPLTVARVLFG